MFVWGAPPEAQRLRRCSLLKMGYESAKEERTLRSAWASPLMTRQVAAPRAQGPARRLREVRPRRGWPCVAGSARKQTCRFRLESWIRTCRGEVTSAFVRAILERCTGTDERKAYQGVPIQMILA